MGYRLISSGGTAAALQAAGLAVTKVADYTGAPEILGGRVKTLHPRIHGGILAKRSDGSHQADLAAQAIDPIDVVVVNLYPFRETVADPAVAFETAIENIDIGGPAMVRAAAKNHADVAVLTSPTQYEPFLAALASGTVTPALRRQLALGLFNTRRATTQPSAPGWRLDWPMAPRRELLQLEVPAKQSLRYGENPHQQATWHSHPAAGWGRPTSSRAKNSATTT